MHNLKKALGSVLAQIESVEENPTPENILILKASVTSLHTVCPDDEKESPISQILNSAVVPMLGSIMAQFGADPNDFEVKTPDGKTVPFPGAEA